MIHACDPHIWYSYMTLICGMYLIKFVGVPCVTNRSAGPVPHACRPHKVISIVLARALEQLIHLLQRYCLV